MGRVLIFLVWGLLCHQNIAFAETSKIALATGEWEPYTSEKALAYGAFTEIVSAVFKEIGMEPEYTFYPWKRAELTAEQGEVFAIFPYILTEARLKTFDFSDKVMPSSFVLFYMKKRHPQGVNYAKLEDLAPYLISGVHGYWYETPFKEAHLNVEYVAKDEQGISKLYLNHVELAAAGDLVGWSLIKRLYPKEVSQFAVAAKPLQQDDLRLMISRKYPNAAELTKKFNAGLAVIRKKGVIGQILARHGLKE